MGPILVVVLFFGSDVVVGIEVSELFFGVHHEVMVFVFDCVLRVDKTVATLLFSFEIVFSHIAYSNGCFETGGVGWVDD